MADERRIMVAISGASGMVYARRLLQVLPGDYDRVYLSASDNALEIMREEIGVEALDGMLPAGACRHAELDSASTANGAKSDFQLLSSTDLHAPPASGSHEYEGLVVVPCSMGVVGRIASGVSNDLVTRAADVCLKERRKLILVIRETPLSLIHLRNLTALAEAGAIVLPAAPAFYGGPETVDDLVDFVVDRILRVLGSSVRLVKGWGE